MQTCYYPSHILDYIESPAHVAPAGIADTFAQEACVYRFRMGSVKQGQMVDWFIQVNDQPGERVLQNIQYRVYGCGYCIAVCDWLAQDWVGQARVPPFGSVLKRVCQVLDIPQTKIQCAVMALTGLMHVFEKMKREKPVPCLSS
jgi:NifU-like protein involved in Fe-S cluster formation